MLVVDRIFSSVHPSIRTGTSYALGRELKANNCITIFKATTTFIDYLVVRCFVGFEIEFRLLLVGLFVRFAAGAVVVFMWMVLDLVVLVLAVVLQRQSVALRLLRFGMDELQLVLVGSNLDRVRQVLLVFLLDVHRDGVVVDELHRLVRLGVLVVHVMVMFCLGGLAIMRSGGLVVLA